MRVKLPVIGISLPPPAPPAGFQRCIEKVGKTIFGRLWGLVPCGCVTVDIEPGPGTTLKDFQISFTGFNGIHRLDYNGSDWVKSIPGALSAIQYSSSDGTCVGVEDNLSGDGQVLLACSDPGSIIVQAGGTVTGIASIAISIFVNADSLPTDAKLPNQTICGAGGDASTTGASGGFFRVIK